MAKQLARVCTSSGGVISSTGVVAVEVVLHADSGQQNPKACMANFVSRHKERVLPTLQWWVAWSPPIVQHTLHCDLGANA